MEIGKFTTVEELEARKTEIKGLLTTLDAEHGVQGFNEEARNQWDELNEELDVITARLQEIEVRAARIAELGKKETHRVEGDGARGATRTAAPQWTWNMAEIRSNSSSLEDYAVKLRDNALHFVEQEQFPSARNDEDARTHIEKLLKTVDGYNPETSRTESFVARRILQTGNPEYRRAFGKMLANQGMTPEEQRALSVGTAASGGYALVYNLDPTIVPTSNSSVNPFRALARVETIAGTNEFKFVTSGAITAAYAAEATEASDNAPTLAQPDIIVEKAQAYVPFSIEIGQDWGALQSEMAQLLQDAKDDLEATKFALGAGHGSTEPKGVITGATNTTQTTTTGAFVIGDLYKLFEALPPRFRPRAAWAANLFIIDKIRQFDTSGGSGVWIGPQGLQAQADAGGIGSFDASVRTPLLGRQLVESTAMASVLTTGTKILIVGDWRYFVIVDRVGMDIEVMPLVVGTNHRPTGERGLYAYWRNSSDVLSAAAFRVLVT